MSSARGDAATSDLLKLLNERHLAQFPGDTELSARIASYELAARMQLSVPRITDLSSESRTTLAAYGADDAENPLKAGFARNCILARRLIERGVRFVQLFNGAYAMGEGVGNWDGHRNLKKQYDIHGPILDQPAAALLSDLKARGLLDETLVVWCTEFGRMPTFQKGSQRPRPQSARLHRLAGRRRRQAGLSATARPTSSATRRQSNVVDDPRLPRHASLRCWASITRG